MKTTRHCLGLGVLKGALLLMTLTAVFMTPCGSASATTLIFEEDFESYAEGSNLFGQGGWFHEPLEYGVPSTDVTLVGTGSGLGSKCANGRLAPGHRGYSYISNLFLDEMNLNTVYVLTFNAFASSGDEYPRSHNSGVKFHSNEWRNVVGWACSNNPCQGYPPGPDYVGWGFGARWIAGGDVSDYQYVQHDWPGHYDTPVTLVTVLDPVNEETYGFLIDGEDTYETNHFAMDMSRFLTIDGIRIQQDYRSPCFAMEIDDIRLIANEAPVAATVTFFTDESDWLAAAGNVEVFSVTSANVATADEVTSPPIDFDPLGNTLTFQAVNTGLSRTFILEALESGAEIVFRNGSYVEELSIGAHEVHEDDDWQMTFSGGPALYAFAFELIVNNDPGVGGEESFSVYGLGGSLLDTDSPPTSQGVRGGFYGVVSDVPIGRVKFNEDTGSDDIDLAEFRFGGNDEVPISDPCAGLGGDTDGDKICDDGDGSGTAGDNPCTNGQTSNCDDNCLLTPNADQADSDGDGIGDVCEGGCICDLNYDGICDEQDLILFGGSHGWGAWDCNEPGVECLCDLVKDDNGTCDGLDGAAFQEAYSRFECRLGDEPAVHTLMPASIPASQRGIPQKVKIKGLNLGATQGSSSLHIGGRTWFAGHPKIKVWEDDKIKFKVPNYVGTFPKYKDIWVTVNGKDSNKMVLEITAP
ncbi:MAG: hypothetical protein SWH78_16175 [Thermodesulfobacteriota bacterium]|nr:hypothetical protein [Thermodesulfobacteriota bacterium]